MSKPRSDAVLLNLPEERQEQVWTWCNTPKKDGCAGGLEHAQEQLAADGVKVSLSQLSRFCSWYRLRAEFRAADSAAKDVEEFLKAEAPGMSPEKIAAAGQLVFTMQATRENDAEKFVSLESLRLAKTTAQTRAAFEREKLAIRQAAEKRAQAKLEFEREKWIETSCQKILDAARDGKAREIAERNVSNAEKIAALRETYFADVQAVAEKLELPE